jgi:hypothetical protein
MGVDIGKQLHATVGIKTGRDQYTVLAVKECQSYNELHDFATKMNVRLTIMDAGPYDHGARDYQKAHNGTFLCYYSESMPGNPSFNNEERSVKVNRNEWCDKVYETFMDKRIQIPRSSPVVDEYMKQLTCTEQGEVTNEAGLTRPRWLKRGADHFWHATLYFLLGCSRSSIKKLSDEETKRYKYCKSSFHI